MTKYLLSIGIEIHLALNTKSKMFSPASNSYFLEPNTSVHPIDLAYPGTLPRVNQKAILKAIKLAKALKMDIDQNVRFDRKNYFYPDLPKGFQITQQFHPIAKKGTIYINDQGKWLAIPIQRFHLEEDTAQQIIREGQIHFDFNRAGSPLAEIVTDPIFTDANHAIAYIEMIRELAQTLDISSGQMELGTLRADLNISLRQKDEKELGHKVEIKNLNSLSNMQKAIQMEIAIQKETLEKGQVVQQVTKRFDEKLQTVVTMRSKEDAIDYRYFREPNIPSIIIDDEVIEKVTLPELPWEYRQRFKMEKLNDLQINLLSADSLLREYFEKINYPNRQKVANILFAEIVSLANKKKVHVKDLGILPEQISEMIELQDLKKISGKHIKSIVPLLIKNQKSVLDLCQENNLILISSRHELEKALEGVLEKIDLQALKSKHDEKKLTNMLLGLVMKATKGNADPIIAKKIIQDYIK